MAGQAADWGLHPEKASGPLAAPAVDCPDGLARCEEGTVTVSRLATLPMPCNRPGAACACPWEIEAECPYGCAAEGVELVVDRAKAGSQLCAPAPDAGPFASPGPVPPAAAAPPGAPGASPVSGPEDGCDEGDRYRCTGGRVIDCDARRVAGACARGCFADGTSIGDDGVNREAAFAILCSR